MIREEEYKTLWGLVSDCSYSKRLTELDPGKLSLLNPVIVAFLDAGQYWIVLRSEYTPRSIDDKLPPKGVKWRRDFHNDIKPGNMVSDRKEVAKMLMYQRMLTGLQLTPALDDIMARLEIDVDYLASKKLMDYSLLVYGSIIEFDHSDEDSRQFFSSTTGLRGVARPDSVDVLKDLGLRLGGSHHEQDGLPRFGAPQSTTGFPDIPAKVKTGTLTQAKRRNSK